MIGLAFGGCGSEEPESGGDTSPPAQLTTETIPETGQGQWGSYPADTTLDEREVVEAYVEALDERDGARFCSVVAPWISGRFDIGGTDPDASLSRPVRCPGLVAGFIGYIEDCCPPKFLGAAVADTGELDRREDVVGVPITVTLRREESERGTYEEPLEDIVWVTRDSGAWRVAKLSLVAAAASIALTSEADYNIPPDVEAERRTFAAEVARAEKRRREHEEAYREVAAKTSCPGDARYPDGGKDVVDYRHPAPPSPTTQLPAADIRAVQVDSSDGRICVVFEMAGEIRGGTTFDFAIESVAFEWGVSGFTQGFEVELRTDGRARVTSGRNDERQTISVPATVGRDGNRLQLVVDRASFAAGRPFPGSRDPSPPLARFMFRGDVTVVLSEKRYLHDDLGPGPPEGVLRYTYPPSS
jgi:hypothetical protein